MDKELAQMVLMTALRTRVELGDLMPLLARYGEAEKDEPVKIAIATAVYEIGAVMDKLFEHHPDLGTECEERRNKYGRPHF